MVSLIVLMLAASPATRPATRPAAHILTQEEKARIVWLNRELAEANQKIRKAQIQIQSERKAGPYGSGRAQMASSDEIDKTRREIARMQQELVLIRRGLWTGPFPDPPTEMGRIAVGKVGLLEQKDERGNPKLYRIVQIVGPEDYLIDAGSAFLWIHGESTAGKVDGQYFEMPNSYRVSGTKQYTTAANSMKTVFVIEPDRTPTSTPAATGPS